jgi:hypothetical protein
VTREEGKNEIKVKQIKKRRKGERNIVSYIILGRGREVDVVKPF